MIFIIGCCFGSFGYLVATRQLSGLSLIFPASHCTTCKSHLHWYELIPVISFTLQAGRCRHCQVKLPFGYLVAELTCGLLFVLCLKDTILPTSLLTLFWLYTAWILSIVDIYSQLLDLGIFFSTTLLLWGFQLHLKTTFHWETLLYCLVFVCFFYHYYKNKFGTGDLYLLLAWSPWLSLTQFCLLLLISSSLGLVSFLIAKLLQKKLTTLPFIPYLSCGLLVITHCTPPVVPLF